jgi:hypothetical protein
MRSHGNDGYAGTLRLKLVASEVITLGVLGKFETSPRGDEDPFTKGAVGFWWCWNATL